MYAGNYCKYSSSSFRIIISKSFKICMKKTLDISEIDMDLKSQIQSTFKLSGLTVRIEASKYLAGLLGPVPDEDR